MSVHNGPRKAYRNRPDRRKLPNVAPAAIQARMEFTAIVVGDFIRFVFDQDYVWDGHSLPKVTACLNPGDGNDFLACATCEVASSNELLISFDTGALEPGSMVVWDPTDITVHGVSGAAPSGIPHYCQDPP